MQFGDWALFYSPFAHSPRRRAQARRGVVVDADQEWGPAVFGQVLGITTDREVYAPGEPITLKIFLKNVSDHDVQFIRYDTLFAYRFSVSLPDGKAAPLTLYGKDRTSRSHASGSSYPILKPGEVVNFDVELSRMVDFSLAGRYTVSMWGGVIDVKDKQIAATKRADSNRLEITVDLGDQPNSKPGIRAKMVEVDNVQVTLSIPKACKLGQPARLTITIWSTDNSDHAQAIYLNDKAGLPNGRTKLELLDRDTNALVPFRESARHKLDQPDRGDFPGGPTELGGREQGSEASWTVDLNDWYVLKPGQYKLKTTLSLPQMGQREARRICQNRR